MPFAAEAIFLGLIMPLAFAYLMSVAGLLALSIPASLKALPLRVLFPAKACGQPSREFFPSR